MLILDIYDYSDEDLTTELRESKSRLWDHWERGWPKDLPNGMFCRMYYPKMEGNLTPLDVCPPALVFRGSEMEAADVEELAIHVDLSATVTASGLPGLLLDTTTFTPSIPVISPARRISPSATRAELRAAGLSEQPLVLPSSGQEVIRASLGGAIGLGNINIDWNGSASLFFGENGDWPTNISQALGHVPTQYRDAIKFGREAAMEAMSDWNGRLMILGHSLGGGLASCAALAAKAAQPDLALRCNTYNAAGLHKQTAKEAGTSLSDAASAGITANSVHGDVLTSIQTDGLVPLLSDVLRWGGVELPPAIPSQSPTFGYSPGGPPSMMFTRFERAPKWHRLPRLFPLRHQTLVEGDLGTIQSIFDAARDATDFSAFVRNLLQMLFQELGDGNGALRSWHVYHFYEALDMIGTQFANSGPAMKHALALPPPTTNFPEVNFGDSGYMQDQVHPFINGMLRDSVELAQILVAAVDYHMWDACAYTFLLDPPEGMFRWNPSSGDMQ